MTNTPIPKHEVLSEEEAKKVLETYRVSLDELPRIRKQDPALKGLTVKVGDIVRITRKSATAGESLYYRAVVN